MRTKITLTASIAILALVLSACAPNVTGSTVAARTISVNGTGTVYLTPDIAYINIGVHTENPEVGKAVDMNSQKSQAVMTAIKALGVEAKDIQTTNFSVNNSIQYDPTSGLQTGTIYMVDNTVIITMRDLAKMSDILDASIQAGANNINSVSFDIADKSEAVQQARLLALENAHKLATELTDGAGVTLGDVQTLSYYDYSPSPFYGKGGEGVDTAASSAPINPGQMQLTVDVSIIYEIK
ncbi:MAG: hypothetical protein A2X25_08645 [Chloroflexi bacterium GWB2_49_20]|nr:MAG: hypothetical protein A2X25_08645 [Chloroflexi bacterium GWB2_49_20]OGN79496.1 MAG: hypothetical protein A2X26_05380 [Chloroflexi bacterium GWC2_49_37]OGN84581.1 MAG: hypothetical protein A2X27_11150 [Chloroflexi bacterium GWD2_49_16]HCC78797.1 hypothetical protein [Anaerolineae bacterium]HCM97202.1 hypothetical protein [Anaerolineae bacterium]